MPPLPGVPHVVRIDHHYTWGIDTNVMTRTFWDSFRDLTTGESINLANASVASWGARWAPILWTGMTIQQAVVTNLSGPTAAVGVSTAAPISGTDGGEPVSADTAIVVNAKIARRYRGGHPKQFMGGGTNDDLTNPQQWSDAAVAEFLSAAQNYDNDVSSSLGGITGHGGVRVAISYFHNNVVVINPITGRARNVSQLRGVPLVDPVAINQVDKTVGSQRRRSLMRR